jgi:general secretion pathway protein M
MNIATMLAKHPWLSRVMALALLVLILLALALISRNILRERHQHYDQIIEQRIGQIEGYGRVAANGPLFQSAMDKIQKLNTSRYYLKNSSPSLAAAEIQETAQSVLDNLGLKVNSINIAPHKDEDGRRKVTVNLNIRGNTEATQKLLYALETKTPYLFVDNLSLRGTINTRRWQPTPLVEPEIQVQFDLSGYALLGKLK